MLSHQLLDPKEREELNQMLFDVEKMVFETEMTREERSNGDVFWVERVKGNLSLYDIEMAMESNPDFMAYFEKEDGTVVTKFDIERELDKIRKFVYARVRDRASKRRFKKFR